MKSLIFEYQQKRDNAILSAEDRKREVFRKCPELEELELQISKLNLELAKTALLKHDSNINSKLKKQIEQKKQERLNFLKKLKINEDDFKPIFECNICDDTGYISNLNRMCTCYKQKRINNAYKQSNLDILQEQNFDYFDEKLFSDEVDNQKYAKNISPRANIIRLRKRCEKFIKDFDNEKEKNLLFTGATGLGKTFMASCIAKEMIEKGKNVIYQTAPRLLDLIMNYKMRFEKPQDFNDVQYNQLFEVDLLIIDDLGVEIQNSGRLAEVFEIINSRIITQKTKGTKTIISTNLSLEEMGNHYADRIVSRIIGNFDICTFVGEDIRIQKVR